MNPFRAPDADERLVIYLNDHRALMAAELSLADRSRSANEGTDLAHDLTMHIGAVSTDRDCIGVILERLGGSVDHVKSLAATIGEYVGRLKTNGQLTGTSPLSRVVELEALLASTATRRTMWSVLAHDDLTGDGDRSGGVRERFDAAMDQTDALRAHLEEAADLAFRTETRHGMST